MVKEGIVLDHVVSKKRIEVDKAKVDLIINLLPVGFNEHSGSRMDFKILYNKTPNYQTLILRTLDDKHHLHIFA